MAKKSQPQVDLSWVVPNALCWQDLDNKDPMFSPALVISSDGKIITIKLESGGQIQCKPTQVLERADPTILGNKGFDDMNYQIIQFIDLGRIQFSPMWVLHCQSQIHSNRFKVQ